MDETNCTDIKNLMNRITGQINGIKRMIDEKRDYIEIIQQIKAVQSALSRLGVELLKDESNKCFNKTSSDEKVKKFEELVANFFKIA